MTNNRYSTFLTVGNLALNIGNSRFKEATSRKLQVSRIEDPASNIKDPAKINPIYPSEDGQTGLYL